MANEAFNRVLDVLIWALLALGISTPANEVVAGLCLAIAAALAVRRFMPERDRRELHLTIAIAVLAALIAAMTGDTYLPDVLVQLKMCIAGGLSRFIVMAIAKSGMAVERRADDVADQALDRILPGKDKE